LISRGVLSSSDISDSLLTVGFSFGIVDAMKMKEMNFDELLKLIT
jgi:hypothetical protein